MKTFITQPTYLPWIGIFKAIEYCDNFVFYDDVQFERKSWQSRNKILNKSTGREMFLTVPIKKAGQKTFINKIEIGETKFYISHLKKIEISYKKTKNRDEVIDLLKDVYTKNFILLSDLNIELIKNISKYIGIGKNFIRSSSLGISGDKFTRPLAIALNLKTALYLTQAGTKDYLDIGKYEHNGIKVRFLDFVHPVYDQHYNEFLPYLSIVDALINIGPEGTRNIIQNIKI